MSFSIKRNGFVVDKNKNYGIIAEYALTLFKSIICKELTKHEYQLHQDKIIPFHQVDIVEQGDLSLESDEQFCIVCIEDFKEMVNFFRTFDHLILPLEDNRLKEYKLHCVVFEAE